MVLEGYPRESLWAHPPLGLSVGPLLMARSKGQKGLSGAAAPELQFPTRTVNIVSRAAWGKDDTLLKD